MNKIKKMSVIFKYLFYGLLIAYPLLVILYWIAPFSFTPSTGVTFGIPLGTVILHHISATEKILGALISLLPNLINIAIFYCLAKLFSAYQQGKIFVLTSTRYLKRAGIFMLVNNLLTPFIIEPLMQWFITSHNPAGQRYIAITYTSKDLYITFVSLLIILISWIMTEACKLHDEQQLTV